LPRSTDIESDALQLTTEIDSTGAVTIAAEGYLDAEGGERLGREAEAAVASGHTHVLIDLEEVMLFNCAGVRWLLLSLEDLKRRHSQVDLVHLRPPLKRILDFTA